MGYEYTTNDVHNVTFFHDKNVEIDHVWVESAAVPDVVAFLTDRGFGSDVAPAPDYSGHTLGSAKEYLAQRIVNAWKEPN